MLRLFLALFLAIHYSCLSQPINIEAKVEIIESPAQKLMNRSIQLNQLKAARAAALNAEEINRIRIDEYNQTLSLRANRNPELLYQNSKKVKLRSKDLTISSILQIPNWWTQDVNTAFVNLEDGTHFNIQIWESDLNSVLNWYDVKSPEDLVKKFSKQKTEGSLGYYYYGAADSIKKFNGLYVHTVLEGRAADRIGLLPGDVIYRLNNEEIKKGQSLIYSPFAPGDTLFIEFARGVDSLMTFGIAEKSFNASSATTIDGYKAYTEGQEFVYNDLGKLRAGTLFTVKVPIEEDNILLNFSFSILSRGEYVDHYLELDRFRRLISQILSTIDIQT